MVVNLLSKKKQRRMYPSVRCSRKLLPKGCNVLVFETALQILQLKVVDNGDIG